ncbi:MAG TPA: DNA-3-methyladenine glycosylase, partial [Candidatus Dormibacteraeota bacterium]|nr:DNA-3-methyladenine glycosylase [Candidatus Dormibacteraeota bacterium]
ANVVCERDGRAGAVLLRAASVTAGEEVVRERRLAAPRRGEAAGWRRRPDPGPVVPPATRGRTRAPAPEALLRGPGNLCRGLGITLADNGLDVTGEGSRVLVVPPQGVPPPLASGPRVGIARATDAPRRFAWAGHPAVSSPRL